MGLAPQMINGRDQPAGKELQTLGTLLTIDEQHKTACNHNIHAVQGTGLECEDLTYTVVKKQEKEGQWNITQDVNLLHGITAHCPRGQVTAVMGPSGAGKSTFLDAVAGRIASGSLGGLITVDGENVNPSLMKRLSAYVMQDDQLFPMLTVRETLMFAAEVRLPSSTSHSDKQTRVNKLIEQLGLITAQNTYIGDEGHRGVSGGERRRVSIGVDIIHGPALLFLDEPTSGLDSTSALSVIEKVHDIALAGSTVILTIHQPSYRIVQLLNRVIVLARGKLIYQGSPSYLNTHMVAFGREVPKGENSIEYLLDVIQEYDRSTYGLEPLVQFNKDGAKPTSVQLTSRAHPMALVYQRSPRNGSPLRNTRLDADEENQEAPMTPLHNEDDSLSFDEDDDYDHSLTRNNFGNFRLASTFYAGNILEQLGEQLGVRSTGILRTPVHTSSESKTPSRGRTPKRGNPQRTPAQTTPIQKTPSRLPTSGLVPYRMPPSEIGLDTPTPTQGTSDCTLDEHDFECDNTVGHRYGPKFANNWVREVMILVFRNFLNIKRTPELFLSRQMLLTIMGSLMATLFVHTPHTLQGVTQLLSFDIFTVSLFFFSSNDAVPTFIQERFILIRETSHNAYRSSSYVVAGVITYLPFLAVQAMTYVLLTWWALSLDGGWQIFLFFWLVLFVSLITTNSFVMFISALVPNYSLGYSAVIAFTALYFLTCGYFLNGSKIPKWWKWLHYISTMKYPYEALLRNQFDQNRCYSVIPGGCALGGRDLLTSLSITKLTKWQCLYILIGWAIFYRIMFYFVLRFASKNQRK